MEIEKKEFSYDSYGNYHYTGLQGVLMRQNHRILSKGVQNKFNKKILEIGGGVMPHFSVVDLNGVEEYWISDCERGFKNFTDNNFYKVKKHHFDFDINYENLLQSGNRFTRIIASHVWEHVHDPENVLIKWIKLLEDDGQIDISIPCDPGWLWRLGQLIGSGKATKMYGLSISEIELMMTREHINPCQNLLRIIRYYTNTSAIFYPTNLPIPDLNLFIFFRINKSNIR